MTWIRAGGAYFAAVFTAGFLFGVIRVLLVIPRIGELAATAVEIPIMLAIAWFCCRKAVARFQVPATLPDRLAMGCLALILTLFAEAAISVLLAGRSIPEHIALYQQAHVQTGFAAQLATALFPAIQNKKA